MPLLTSAQIRAAVAATGKPLKELAALLGVTPPTISKIQRHGGGRVETIRKLREGFERMGFSFRAESGRVCVCFPDDEEPAEAEAD